MELNATKKVRFLEIEPDAAFYGKLDREREREVVELMKYDPLYYPYQSRRMTTFACKGMVATSQPLAAQAGLEIWWCQALGSACRTAAIISL